MTTSTEAAISITALRKSFGETRSMTSTPPTLEELFLRHYGDEQATGKNVAS